MLSLKKNFSEGFAEAEESGFFDHKMIKGLDDRIVISVDIKTLGYQTYSLDAQVDTGAMNSCAKFGAIPEYYWQNTNLDFRAVNNTLMKIEKICPDFPLYIQNLKVPVTLYSFDTGSDILLGQDFVNKCIPLTVTRDCLILSLYHQKVSVPYKTEFQCRVKTKPVQILLKSLQAVL
jgi:hypothetical protein